MARKNQGRRIAACNAAVVTLALCAGNASAFDEVGSDDANRQALIVGVGRYAFDPAAKLDGVDSDRASARTIAKILGIEKRDVVELADRQADRRRVLAALSHMNETLPPGGKAFFYFSGHGTRFLDDRGQCREGLLLTDGSVLTREDLADYLAPLAATSDSVIVVIDACFSEGSGQGVTNLSRSVADEVLAPRFYKAPLGVPKACSPVNEPQVSRDLSPSDGLWVRGASVEITTARKNEVAWDSVSGGVGTTAILKCMREMAGSIEPVALQRCAQREMNRHAKAVKYAPSHVVVTSKSRGFIPASFKTGEVGDQATPPIILAPLLPAKPLKPMETNEEDRKLIPSLPTRPDRPPSIARIDPYAAAVMPQRAEDASIYESAVTGASVRLNVRGPTMLRRDRPLDLRFQVPFDGYTYIINRTSDGKPYLIYPDATSASLRLFRAGSHFDLKSMNCCLVMLSGARSLNRILVVHSPYPLELSVLKLKRLGINALGGESSFYSFDGFDATKLSRWIEGRASQRKPSGRVVHRDHPQDSHSTTGGDSESGYAVGVISVKEVQ